MLRLLLATIKRLVWCRRIFGWKYRVVRTIVSSVFPPGTPYLYDSAPSFIQPSEFDPADPVRVTLFFPDLVLAIDVVGPDFSENYREARRYVNYSEWEKNQAQLANKSEIFRAYRVPYVVIRYGTPVDAASLRERVRGALGRSV